MPINATNNIPLYCKNCLHRFVCSIQSNIKAQDVDVVKFNADNVPSLQSVTSTNYNCRYKAIDTTV